METKRVKRGGEKKMCIGKDEVRGIVLTALEPNQKLLDDMKKSLQGIVKLTVKQTELEGQILNLTEKSKDREKFEDELFGRVRAIETMTEPRSSCTAIFTNLEKGQAASLKAFETLDKQIKDRTWALVVILFGAFLSIMGSLTVGLVVYFVKTGGSN